ncbi:hypothetical protein N2152v2_009733 [Parachlorella kessleri]
MVTDWTTGGGGRSVEPVSSHNKPPVQQQRQRRQQQQQRYESWWQTCEQVADFQRQHGRVPCAIADAQGPLLPGEQALGLWCTEQQRCKAGSKGPPLTAEERAALQAVSGWRWWASKPVIKPWEERLQDVEEFFWKHGRLPRKTAGKSSPFLPGEQTRGRWVNRQRQQFRGHELPALSAERIAALERTPGWSWGDYLTTPWKIRCQQLQDFVRQHGGLPKVNLGRSDSGLPGEKELGGVVLEVRSLAAWELRCQQVEGFVRQHGRLPRAQESKVMPFQPNERELGVWCHAQRRRGRGTSKQPPLTAEQLAALAAVPGWFWYEVDRWEERRQQLEAFVRQHGRMPRRQATQKQPLLDGEHELGNWVKRQLRRHRGMERRAAPLTAKQLAALRSIPLWGGANDI